MLAHLTSVPPVNFLLSTVEGAQLQPFLFRPADLPFHAIMVFNIRLCYHSRVMCYRSLVPVGPRFKHAWAAAFFPRATSCYITSSHVSRARVSSTAPRVFESCCLKGKTNKDTQAAQLCAPPECSEVWQTQAAQPSALLPCFFLLHFHNVTIRNFHAAIVTLRWMTLSCKTQ